MEGQHDAIRYAIAAHGRRFHLRARLQEALMRAYAAAIKRADAAQAEMQWTFARRAGAYATGLVRSEESLDYLQELNVETGVQEAVLPFERVAGMSLAREDAIELLG
jgi:hypothetical protein